MQPKHNEHTGGHLSCTYLARHELESVILIVVVIIITTQEGQRLLGISPSALAWVSLCPVAATPSPRGRRRRGPP